MPRMGGYTPTDHKATHQDGGRDEINIASLSGTPAALTTHAALKTVHHTNLADIEVSIGDGTNEISTGVQLYVQVDFACTISAAKLLAKESGSIVIDIWKQPYADFPPEDANSITASAPPTLSSAQKSSDTTLTGWTTAIAAGDCLGINVDSVTTITQVTLVLKVTKS